MDDLAERFVSDSYRFGKVLTHGRLRKEVDECMAAYRVLMMKARKFKLDDDFTDLATRASMIGPEEALMRVQGTILPYDVVWMEYNPRAKVAASIAISDNPNGRVHEAVRDKAAFLMIRDRNNPNAFSVQQVSEAQILRRSGGETALYAPHPMGIIFDADGHIPVLDASIGGLHSWKRSIELLCNQELVRRSNDDGSTFEDISSAVWGYVKGNTRPNGRLETRGLASLLPEGLRGHAAIAYARVFEKIVQSKDTDADARRVILDQLAEDVRENSGIMRWISTVLCMLAEVPVNVSEPRTNRETRIRSASGIKPGFERHYVTLNLPRVKNRIRYVARKIAGGGRKKRHEVQAHWRTYLSELGSICEAHAWEYSEDLSHRKCKTCESFSTKIKNHLRGDENLGWAAREVRVTAKKEDGR